MNEYHKIQTVFLRDPETKFKTLLMGQYALPEFEYLANNDWVFTEKVDGTNIRIMFNGERVTFGGRTDNAMLPVPLVERLQAKYLPMTDVFKEKFPDGVCFYGEGYGAKIQKHGGLYRADQDFVLFDIKIGPWWLQRESIEEIASEMGIDIVPVIGEGTLHEMIETVSAGFNSIWGNFISEGIVARPKTELVSRNGRRIITKLKHSDFAETGSGA